MSSEIRNSIDLTEYGMTPDYSVIRIGDLYLWAAKASLHRAANSMQFVMTVEYRGAQDDIRGNLVLTAGGEDRDGAVAQMQHTLNAYKDDQRYGKKTEVR